jgi:hypothetical protein
LNILAGKPEEDIPLGGQRCRSEKEMVLKDVNWTELAVDRNE